MNDKEKLPTEEPEAQTEDVVEIEAEAVASTEPPGEEAEGTEASPAEETAEAETEASPEDPDSAVEAEAAEAPEAIPESTGDGPGPEETQTEAEAAAMGAGAGADVEAESADEAEISESGEEAVASTPEGIPEDEGEGTKAEEKTAVAAEATPESTEEGAKAEDAQAEAPIDTGPPKRWYVVHTYSGHENKVRDNIQKMINASGIQDHFGQIIVPTEEVTEMKKGKKTVTTRKFFPSYILVEMHMSDESRHLVSDIPGVTSFVGTASGPQPLSKAEVERILGRMDKEKQTIIPEIPFALGEHIRIKDGPFSDFTGIIDEINAERGKLKVLVSIFGRETPVELDFLQVENL